MRSAVLNRGDREKKGEGKGPDLGPSRSKKKTSLQEKTAAPPFWRSAAKGKKKRRKGPQIVPAAGAPGEKNQRGVTWYEDWTFHYPRANRASGKGRFPPCSAVLAV